MEADLWPKKIPEDVEDPGLDEELADSQSEVCMEFMSSKTGPSSSMMAVGLGTRFELRVLFKDIMKEGGKKEAEEDGYEELNWDDKDCSVDGDILRFEEQPETELVALLRGDSFEGTFDEESRSREGLRFMRWWMSLSKAVWIPWQHSAADT